MGALVAAEFCRDLGLRDIILEGDSKMVVDTILKKAPSRSTYGHTVGDTLEVLKIFRSWAAGHVKRTTNEAAHRLAKGALRETSEKIWIEEIPNTIIDDVTLEQFALIV
jgi:ribonuclease HI